MNSKKSKEWTYLLTKIKLPQGDIVGFIENEILGKWKYNIPCAEFRNIIRKLKQTVANLPEIINAKYIADKDSVELNIYCLNKDQRVYDAVLKECAIKPYTWKTDKETLSELFTKSFRLFSKDLIKIINEMEEFDEKTKSNLIRDSVLKFIEDYNSLIDKENLPHQKVSINSKITGILCKVIELERRSCEAAR